jgi:hypothetical protein
MAVALGVTLGQLSKASGQDSQHERQHRYDLPLLSSLGFIRKFWGYDPDLTVRVAQASLYDYGQVYSFEAIIDLLMDGLAGPHWRKP